jgi:hypothetical protein
LRTPKRPASILAALLLAATAPALAQKVNVKPGLWDARPEGAANPVKVCFSREVLGDARVFMAAFMGPDCTIEVKEATPKLVVTRTVCKSPVAVEDVTRIETPDPGTMARRSRGIITSGGKRQEVTDAADFKWVRADCGDVKPLGAGAPKKR